MRATAFLKEKAQRASTHAAATLAREAPALTLPPGATPTHYYATADSSES